MTRWVRFLVWLARKIDESYAIYAAAYPFLVAGAVVVTAYHGARDAVRELARAPQGTPGALRKWGRRYWRENIRK